MIVEQLVPSRGTVELDTVFAGLRNGAGTAEPFAEGTITFFAEVSRRLGSGPGSDLWVVAHKQHKYGRFPENRVVSG